MKEEVIKIILECSPKYRIRFIKKTEHINTWFLETYPRVPLDIAVYALLNDVSPYCCICGNPVKSRGKKTCSTKCRTLSLLDKKYEIDEKRKQTNIKKYGSETPSSSPKVIQKRLDTMVKKYGAKVSPKSIEAIKSRTHILNEKGKKTLQEKYGVNNPGQLIDHHAKCVATLQKNYGVDHYYKSQEFKNIISDKNIKKWNTQLPTTITLLDILENSPKQELFANPNKEIKFKCITCGTVDNVPSETVKWRIRNTGTPCICCSGINMGSLKQREVYEYIKSLNVNVVANYKLNNNKEIDIFCPEHKIGFEFDGLFWHNDLRVPKSYHLDKTVKAAEQNIVLIHIFEDEWDYKKEIVKSRIKNLLGVTGNKIFAKNCTIKPLNKSEEIHFLETNHIQGFARSSISYGLYHHNELVSVMTFSKPSKAKGQKMITGHWELLRFCSILDTTVVGGASKLLKYFVKTHSPIQVLSFADRRWSTGNLYKNLGFQEKPSTALNYWYIKGDKRYHRFGLRKNKNDNQSLTEYENRLSQGYLRIWDCGSSKWILST